MQNNKVNFGFKSVDAKDKVGLVKGVFDSVADKYDIMNDAMSLGLHRLWKRHFLFLADMQPQYNVLDLAAGSGDLSILMAKQLTTGKVTVSDINESMLAKAEARVVDSGVIEKCDFSVQDAHNITFPDNTFDMVTCGFGLRNTTHIDQALSSIFKVLKPGGSLWVLEFSQVNNPMLAKFYDVYSHNVIPKIGKILSNDEDSYRYLVESIRMHPNQEKLLKLMQDAGFSQAKYTNLTAGVVAIHSGWKS